MNAGGGGDGPDEGGQGEQEIKSPFEVEPVRSHIHYEERDDRSGLFTIEPLDKGFGHTYGNSLRRVLLSSLAGAAVTSVRIEGVSDAFADLPGVKEDMTDIILNLKDVVPRMNDAMDQVEARLVSNGCPELKAGDIDLPAGVEILNPDSPIATVDENSKLEMYLTIGRGRGYSPAEDNETDDQALDVIPIDSNFSPIRRASYRVDSARVGQKTDFDKLLIDVETDGSLEPPAALREASQMLIASFAIFTDADRVEEITQSSLTGSQVPGGHPVTTQATDDRLIEELEIGVRAYNALKRAGVQTIGDLQAKSKLEVRAIPNLGERSLQEILLAMRTLGYRSKA